jgi:hypothetical protein
MKNLFTIITLSTLSISFAQKENKIDTTTFRLGENTIIFINEAPDSNTYTYDLNHADSLCIKNCKKSDWPKFTFDIGANGYLNSKGNFKLNSQDELYTLDYGRSRSVGFAFQFKGFESKNKRWYISPGLGYSWNNYHFENNVKISSDSKQTSMSLDTLIKNSKYKLRVAYLEVPLIVGTKFENGKNPLNIQLGVIGGLKTGSLIKQQYNESGSDFVTKNKSDFNINSFKVDYIARIYFDDIGLFARYSATNLFEKNKSPELHPFSIGFSFTGF